MINSKTVTATNGKTIAIKADTICIHGDGKYAIKIIEAEGAARLSLAIGSDHGGFALKEQLKASLLESFAIRDAGAHSAEAVDYPDFAAAVGRLVATSQCDFGIVIDAMGIGSAMAANKIRGIRAAVCHDEASARNAREHNDANVITMGAKQIDAARALPLIHLFVATKCVEERHKRRVAKIIALERS